MPYIDSVFFNKKAEKKRLTLQLSDGEDILESIKLAMQEQKISECRVEDASGKIKHIIVNSFEGNRYVKKEFSDEDVLRASGSFKLSYSDLWGSMHISIGKRKPFSATLVAGKAAEGFELVLSFVQEIKGGQGAK